MSDKVCMVHVAEGLLTKAKDMIMAKLQEPKVHVCVSIQCTYCGCTSNREIGRRSARTSILR